MSRSTINLKKFVEWVNLELQFNYSRDTKMGLCMAVEQALHQARAYKGFNYYYWLQCGYKLWFEAGEPGGKEKEKYLYGPNGTEWNRHYYV